MSEQNVKTEAYESTRSALFVEQTRCGINANTPKGGTRGAINFLWENPQRNVCRKNFALTLDQRNPHFDAWPDDAKGVDEQGAAVDVQHRDLEANGAHSY